MNIAFDISLNIEHLEYGRSRGTVAPKEVPTDRISISEYARTVLGENTHVEYLSRTSIPGIKADYRNCRGGVHLDKPTSLLFQTVHTCFSEHYPLALRPEVLWHQVLCEIATCVKQNPEDYRHLFTALSENDPGQAHGDEIMTSTTERKAGTVDIHIRADHLVRGSLNNNWASVLGSFEAALTEHVPEGTKGSMLPGFSTDSEESRCAQLVTFMAAASPFYDYHTHTMCGIPKIRLLGELADYERMVSSAKTLAPLFEKHLGKYFTALIPVLQKLVSEIQATQPDENFWKSLYQFKSESGSDKCNGWITAFVNYVNKLEFSKGQIASGNLVQKSDNAFNWKDSGGTFRLNGIAMGSVPSQIATAPFTWHYLDKTIGMVFFAGPLGIETHDGYLTTELGYGIAEQGE